jgi:hypothetical protein
MANAVEVDWNVIEFLVNLSEVNSELIHMAMKRVDCECSRPSVMNVLSRNYRRWWNSKMAPNCRLGVWSVSQSTLRSGK